LPLAAAAVGSSLVHPSRVASIPVSVCILALAVSALACVGSPSPLAPALRGSIGVPHHGVVTDARPLAKRGDGFRLLRDNGVHWGNPRLVAAIEHAARGVAAARPGGAPLVVGDLSLARGGEAAGHRSHRTGRDVDLLLFALTPEGRSVETPGFVRFGADGLAQSNGRRGKTFLRIDVERQWLLVKALIEAPEAHVQWVFVAHWLEALLIEYARARGEDPELVWHAETVLLQPRDAAAHDDHLHVRIACTPDEAVTGCHGGGPRWPWLAALPELAPPADDELARAVVGDLLQGGDGPAAAGGPASAATP
jgi:penicillin-insensitive murein DD-endopeptidase